MFDKYWESDKRFKDDLLSQQKVYDHEKKNLKKKFWQEMAELNVQAQGMK